MNRFHPRTQLSSVQGASAFWFVLRGYELLVDEHGRVPSGPTSPLPHTEPVALGLLDDAPCFASGFEEDQQAPPGFSFRPVRSLHGALDEACFAVAGRAMQLVEWDRSHRFCGRCGKATQREPHERNRKCLACSASHFPRVSPAVIGVVEWDGKILLAKNAQFARPFYSAIAGFVDAGESLEEAFAREVQEEVGLRVTDIRYFGSQSWPFTSSLMVGFTARYLSGEIRVDGKEIADAQWFSPGALPDIPPPISIARQLIDHFAEQNRSR